MTTNATPQEPQSSSQEPEGASQPIVAQPATYYRWTRYIMAVILVAYGAWSCYDGFYNWPNWKTLHPNDRYKEKSQTDILFNQVIGVILPPAGVLLLILCMRNSRGEYRLEDNVLYVPGHPPVPLERITVAHKELWERKGIVYLDYDISGAPPGKLKLDDWVYEREPTDKIFDQIQEALLKAPPKIAPVKIAAAPAKTTGPAPAMLKAKTPPRPRLR